MAWTIGCVALLMMAGLVPSCAAAEVTHPPHFRFLSLAEARAIALGQGSLTQPHIRILANTRTKAHGILLTGIPPHPRPIEWERKINALLLPVEVAYWNLYESYWQLHAREQALRLALGTWKTVRERCADGEATLFDLASVENQCNLFRKQRRDALDLVQDNERQLRTTMGLPLKEENLLVPSDAPRLSEKTPDWEEGLEEALRRSPELHLARQDYNQARWILRTIRKVLVPPLRLLGNLDVDTSPEVVNAFRKLPSNGSCTWNDWTPVIRNVSPFFFQPGEPACVRQVALQAARSFLRLQEQELKVERYLGLWYRRMSSAYFQIKVARAQRTLFASQIRACAEKYQARSSGVPLDMVLEGQRFWADALTAEFQAISAFNNAIVGWDCSRGRMRTRAHVRFCADVPAGPAVRAVVFERKRTRSQVRAMSALQADAPLTAADDHSYWTAPALPALWKTYLPLDKVEE